MRFLYNNQVLRDRRRSLRNHQTDAEKFLWQTLSHSKFAGLKFTRQYGVGPYILDFYCPKARLAIELDGKTHASEEAKIYDTERTEFLKSLNIQELRFKNEEVLRNVEQVLERIKQQSLTTKSG